MSFATLFRKALPVVAPFMALMVCITWYVRDNGFFWDSILLASKYGQWYYRTCFSTLFVPQEMAGYPPLFGMYLAAGWQVSSKSVQTSHFLMLPFLLGIVWQTYLLAKRYLAAKWIVAGMLLVLLDPTLLAQSAQVAPDIILLFLYLLCLNAILHHRSALLVVGTLFLAIHTPRSQILLVAVFGSQVLLYWLENRRITLLNVAKLSLPYVPAGLLLLTWLVLHYHHFGWVGYSRTSDWGTYSAFVTPKEFLRNIALIGWRLVDFGRIALWVTAGILLWKFRKTHTRATIELHILLLVPLLVLSSVLVWFTNPIGHRYWLVVYVILGLLTAHLLERLAISKIRIGVLLLLLVSLVSGHFWLYPEKVAKGWDATLAHLPYYNLRKQMMAYLDQQQIAWQEVGSDFPNLASPANTDLTQDYRSFSPKDFSTQVYILQSNVFNGFTDQELDELQHHWRLVHELQKGQVYLRLYSRKDLQP